MSDYSGTARPHGLEVTWKIWGDLNDRDLHNVQAFMDDFFAIWKPRPTRGFKTPVDYATLAYARQCFDLAGDAADMHVSDQFLLLESLRRAMEELEEVEPRFAYAYSLAKYATQLAGEFEIDDAMDGAWDELGAVMPQPLTRPIPGVTEYAIVDDTQTQAAFNTARLPGRSTFTVRFGDLPASDFVREGRMVFPVEMTSVNRHPVLFVDREYPTGDFHLKVEVDDDGTELPHEILREVRQHVDDSASFELDYPISAVEYYLWCARAQECTGLLVADPSPGPRRDELIAAVGEALEYIPLRNNAAAPARLLYDELTSTTDPDLIFEYANAIYHWIPRDFRVCFPTSNTPEADALKDALFESFREQDIGFARVVNRQPSEQADQGLVPQLNHFAVDFLDTFGEAEDLPYSNCFLIQDIDSATRDLL